MAEDDRIYSIMVVEDEPLVRLTIADYLRGCGFRVTEAASADEALDVLYSDAGIGLVFSDIQMPGNMNGCDLARWIRQNRPAIKVVLTSGIADAAAEAADLCDEEPLLSKPYDELMLVDRFKRLLATA